jgi:hypothetical protein
MPGSKPMKTARLCEIDQSDPGTWQDRLFLTIDIDWAHDEVIEHTASLLESGKARATWFVTHETPVLERLRANPDFELAIHPNFNFLLQGDDRNGRDIADVIDRVMKIVPEATTARSHSLTHNPQILDHFRKCGITHESNHFIPASSTPMSVMPWREIPEVTSIPAIWEDLYSVWTEQPMPVQDVITRPELKVFIFHPIHLFLNTDSEELYESTRAVHREPTKLIRHRSDSPLGSEASCRAMIEACS